MYEACDLVGSYLLCQGLLADAQELIDTYLTELELINMSTNSPMYHRKQKICLIHQSMTYCVWSKGIHQTEKLGFWKTLFKSASIAIKMQKKIYFYSYKAKLDGILEIGLSLEIASDNFLL